MTTALDQLDGALAGLERAFAARPRLDGQAFTDATRAISAYRDDQRRAARGDAPAPFARARLKAANLAITLLLAGHFPLGEIPWNALETLRDHLRALRADEAGAG